jgi:hypothetical protein
LRFFVSPLAAERQTVKHAQGDQIGEKMQRAWLLVCLLVLAVGTAIAQTQRCQPSKHGKVPTITKLTYDAARKALIAAGWEALRTKSKTDVDISEGNGPDFWQRGYVEVEACAGTGRAQCAFLFKDSYGNRLRVTTAGEELPREKAHAIVTGSSFVCD